jgi:hypothetical protein
MKHLPAVVVAVLFAMLAMCSGCKDDETRRKLPFVDLTKQYYGANNEQKGEQVVSLLSKSSFDRYTRLMELALNAERSTVLKLPGHDRFEVLLIRQMMTRAQVKKMDARGYIVHATNEGWWVGDKPDFLYGKLSANETDAMLEYRDTLDDPWRGMYFVKEDGQWKIDEAETLRQDAAWVTNEARKQKIDEDDLIVMWIEEIAGEDLKENILEKMK